MAKTVNLSRTEIMNEFGLEEDNDNEGTSSDAILRYLSEANEEFINHRAWRFRLKPYTRYIEEDTTVNTEFLVGAGSVVLNKTDNWGTAGRTMIDYNIIEFTNNNTGTETLTVTAADIQRTHIAGEKALLMYEVPTDYNKYASMFVEGTRYYIEDKRDGKFPTQGRFWEEEVILSNGDIKKYLVFPYHTTRKRIYMRYGKKATDFTTPALNLDTTYIEVPKPYWRYLYHAVASRIYRHLEEHKQAELHEGKAMNILIKAAVFDSKQHYSNKNPLRTEWDNPSARMGLGQRVGLGNYGHSINNN